MDAVSVLRESALGLSKARDHCLEGLPTTNCLSAIPSCHEAAIKRMGGGGEDNGCIKISVCRFVKNNRWQRISPLVESSQEGDSANGLETICHAWTARGYSVVVISLQPSARFIEMVTDEAPVSKTNERFTSFIEQSIV